MNNLLGVFAKYPEPGKVKSRIAREIGEEEAARIYRSLAERVFKETTPAERGYGRIVFYHPHTLKAGFEKWLPGERLILQRGRDIGEKMENALRDLFALGAEKAAVVGVDIPDLDRDIIKQCYIELDSSDVVMGPALDGGYYLIGMKKLHPEIFRGIPWSSGQVYEATIEILHRLQLSVSTLNRLSDVDTVEDLRKFGL
jgi:rSAM/selenodomain-associated transferase 1